MRTVSDGRFHAYGSWQCETTEVRCGPAYRLGVEYRTENVDHDSVSVSMIATWIDARGDWLHRTYIDEISDSENGWRELSVTVDLNRKFYKYWESVGPAYGETQSLHIKERRPDTYGSARSCREG